MRFFNGTPGNPAPVPMSMTGNILLPDLLTGLYYRKTIDEMLLKTSSKSVIAVRFMT